MDGLEARSPGNDILGENRHLIHIAATYGQTACLKVLLDAGANSNEPGGWSNSQPLENAAWAGFADAVKLLIENGADLDARAADLPLVTLNINDLRANNPEFFTALWKLMDTYESWLCTAPKTADISNTCGRTRWISKPYIV